MLDAKLSYNKEYNGFEVRLNKRNNKAWDFLIHDMGMTPCKEKATGKWFLYRFFDTKAFQKKNCRCTPDEAYNILLRKVTEIESKRPEPKKAKTTKKADKPVDLSKLTKAQLIELLQSMNG